jgi:hypothetical protein
MLGTEGDKYGCIYTEKDMSMVAKELRDQVLWLRNHRASAAGL